MVTPDFANAYALEQLLAPYELLRTIGSRPSALHVVRYAAPGSKPKLFVAERFAGAARLDAPEWTRFAGEARRISTLASANVGRVRELVARGDDLVTFWDFIDGERLAETWLSTMPLEVSLRMVLDVLSGAGAIHGLRDAKQQPMGMAHGEISTATIVVGVDGAARLLHAIARRMPGARAEAASLGYLAPEAHTGEAYDARADVFSAGVLLWEALSGTRLFTESDAAEIVARVRGGGAPQAVVQERSAWARPLVTVAAKALAASPGDRWPTAAAMAAEIRKAVGLKLASAMAAAAFANAAMGERVKARRQELESAAATHAKAPEVDAIDTDIDLVEASVPPPATVSLVPEPVEEAMTAQSPPLPERGPPPAPRTAVVAPQPPADDENPPHDFAAAFDVPISIAPPSPDPSEVSPTSVETTGSFDQSGASRGRMVAVLGGVGALGLVVFALAGWRATHRDPAATSPVPDRGRMAVATGPVRPPAAIPARLAVAPSSPFPAGVAAPPRAMSAAESRTPGSPPAVSSAPAAKPPSSAVVPQKAPSSSQTRQKPRSNSGYDPGAL